MYLELYQADPKHLAQREATILRNLAHVLYKTNQFTKAIAIYKKLITQDKTNLANLLSLAQLWIESNKPLYAVLIYNQCIGIDTFNPTAKFNVKLLCGNYKKLLPAFFRLETALRNVGATPPRTIEPTSAIVQIVGSEITVWVGKPLGQLDCHEFSSIEFIDTIDTIDTIENDLQHNNHTTFLPLGCMKFTCLDHVIKVKTMEYWRAPKESMRGAIDVLIDCMKQFNISKTGLVVSETIVDSAFFRTMGFVYKHSQLNPYGDIMCMHWNRYINCAAVPYEVYMFDAKINAEKQ